VAEMLVTNFFCHFGILWELQSDQGHNFKCCLMQVLQYLGVNKTCTTPLWHGETIHQNGQWASAKGCCVTPEGLGHKVTHLPPCPQGINPWQYRFNTNQPSAQERTPFALWPTVLAPPDSEQPISSMPDLEDRPHNIHNYACQHPMPASDWMKTHYDRLAKCVGCHEDDDVWLYRPTRTKGVTQASIPTGGPIQGSNADKQCGVQNPVKPYIKDDAGKLGPPGTLSGNHSGWVALRREQWVQLGSNHCENWPQQERRLEAARTRSASTSKTMTCHLPGYIRTSRAWPLKKEEKAVSL
jgi:hypothetical protein